jgi:hypothetical protein
MKQQVSLESKNIFHSKCPNSRGGLRARRSPRGRPTKDTQQEMSKLKRKAKRLPRWVTGASVTLSELLRRQHDKAEEGITGSDDYVLHAVEFVRDWAVTHGCT